MNSDSTRWCFLVVLRLSTAIDTPSLAESQGLFSAGRISLSTESCTRRKGFETLRRPRRPGFLSEGIRTPENTPLPSRLRVRLGSLESVEASLSVILDRINPSIVKSYHNFRLIFRLPELKQNHVSARSDDRQLPALGAEKYQLYG